MRLEITQKNLVEYGTAGLVLLSGALAGHYAAVGMNLVQLAGAGLVNRHRKGNVA